MENYRIENAIIIKGKTRLEQLTAQFNTKAQAKFYIAQNEMQFKVSRQQNVSQVQENINSNSQTTHNYSGKKKQALVQQSTPSLSGNFDDYESEHMTFMSVLENVQKDVSPFLKTKIVEREFLPSYIFTDKDIVIVIGQDGLVANTAKYVNSIPIIAINPDPARFDGKLLPFTKKDIGRAVSGVLSGSFNYTDVTMARVRLLDGQTLLAFNDLFIGIKNHSSARYKITFGGETENHSSSGIIVSTGAGSTGWLSSLYNMAEGINRFVAGSELIETEPIAQDEDGLVFIIREPFLSRTSQVGISCGIIGPGQELIVESTMPQDGIIFSDGIFSDFINFNSGAIASISIADQTARLVGK